MTPLSTAERLSNLGITPQVKEVYDTSSGGAMLPRKVYVVQPNNYGGWITMEWGGQARATHRTREEALRTAQYLARRQPAAMIRIQHPDGRVEELSFATDGAAE